MNAVAPHLTESQVGRYLSLLGVPRSAPGVDALRTIVSAHLLRVPFENISKLYRWRQYGIREIPDCTGFLDGIEHNHFGGTCYTINFHLYQLLVSLGYEASLCGADMSRPDLHLASVVNTQGREFIVDCGYAAPFLEPLPRDLSEPYEIRLGSDRYVLHPQDATGRSRLDLFRDAASPHGYRLNPRPRRIEEFHDVIIDSFRPDATFMNSSLLVKFGAHSSVVLRNLNLIESHETEVRKTALASQDDLIRAIHDIFGIPTAVASIALDGLNARRDPWG
jgi:N-hydroxyarylamine O-acetyltransferase